MDKRDMRPEERSIRKEKLKICEGKNCNDNDND
jgi:hypothetical protein